jgi:hypothetical protein
MIKKMLVATFLFCLVVCCAGSRSEANRQHRATVTAVDQSLSVSLDEMYQQLISRRNLQIGRMHAYAAAGRFPQNTDFPGRLVPYFVDYLGTACAVGHLMRLDGYEELVNRIAASDNHVHIAEVKDGPLVDWIRNSGLTQEECALIQPSYATIEDYRRGSQWRNESERLGKHFAEVEQTLEAQSQKSLGEALITKIEAELQHDPTAAAFSSNALTTALNSDEANVRIAAAYAIAHLTLDKASREVRITALQASIKDRDPSVRFWTAVALEKTGGASSRGELELHRLTLPVFLEALQSNRRDTQLAALIQLAIIAPECVGTDRQLRIIPEIRRAIVAACEDRDSKVRESAKEILSSWRWQRIAYESQRTRRQYLADSFDFESVAAETLAMDREFADQPPSVAELILRRSLYDVKESIAYLLPVGAMTAVPTAETEAQARQLVDDWHQKIYAKTLTEGHPPFWKIESVDPDASGLYFAATVWRTDMKDSPKMVFVVPRPSMLSEASSAPDTWFETIHQPEQYVWPAAPPSAIRPRAGVHVVLGSSARDDPKAFTATCDLFAYFMAYYTLVVIDRDVQETGQTLTWSGRFAALRQYKTRFFDLGGGGMHNAGGGGWDFHRFTLACDRSTGAMTLSAEPIAFPVTPPANEIVTPTWVTEESKLMGWKPLKSISFFGDRLLPAEYSDAVDQFDPDKATKARDLLYRRWHMEKSLPQPYFVLGLLYDQKGRREQAIKSMQQAAGQSANEPGTLADVARWESGLGMYDSARAHAEAALKLWPGNSAAMDVLRKLEEAETTVP